MSHIQLCSEETCSQCRSCESVCPKHCISFNVATNGFVAPIINLSACIECGLCMKSCHQINLVKAKSKPIRAYASWSTDESVRTTSSSGGVFSEIARSIFDRGGVVFGAVMDESLKVHHTFASNMNELLPMRGSKYVQSDLTGVFSRVKSFLDERRYVLFSGTPCQVAGLYSFLKKDHPFLLTCDLVCHGVPSQRSFDIYCDKVGLKDKASEVTFRFTKGWGFQMAYKTKKGTNKWKSISPRDSYYLRAFTNGLMFNEACYHCNYATVERISDITIADYWGIGTMMPFPHSTRQGVSLLLVNSTKGEDVIRSSSTIFIEERPLEEAVNGNHNLSRCSDRPLGRDTYYTDANSMTIGELEKKYGLKPSFRDYLRPLKRLLSGM